MQHENGHSHESPNLIAGVMASQQPAGDEKKSDHVNIKVVDSDQNEIYFKIKKTTPLRKLMDTYCEKQGKQQNTVRFNFDGMRLNANQTPEQVSVELTAGWLGKRRHD
jgi:small ubiquitin-related modifier